MADVSVVIACRDDGRFLPEAVASVGGAAPVVIADDGSTDTETLAALDALAAEGHTVLRLPARGPGAARNAAVAATSTPVFVPLDADDRLRPELLDLTDRFADERIAVVHTDAEWFGGKHGRWEVPVADAAAMAASNTIPVTALVRRAAFDAVGGYADDIVRFADWDLWLSLLEAGWRFEKIDVVGFDVRARPDSLSRRPVSHEELRAAFAAVQRRHRGLILEHLDDVAANLIGGALAAHRWCDEVAAELEHLRGRVRELEASLEPLGGAAGAEAVADG